MLRDEEFANWKIWLKRLGKIQTCKIPRFYSHNFRYENDITLHLFCDTSKKAYAAVAYWQFGNDYENCTQISFIAAKSRVAPMKPVSIPRLKLQAALLTCKLARCIEDEHEFKIKRRFLWTNSSTVLQWLRSDPRSQPVFIAH